MDRYLQDEFDITMDDHDHDNSTNSTSTDKPWGDIIAASFIVQLMTLSGIVLVAFSKCYGSVNGEKSAFMTMLHKLIIPSFACGALLATAFFLIVPEALELLSGGHAAHDNGEEETGHEGHDHRYLQDDHDHEHDEEEEDESGGGLDTGHNAAAWKFGASILGGFLLPILLGALFPSPDTENCQVCSQEGAGDLDTNLSPQAKSIIDKNEEISQHQQQQEEDEDDENLQKLKPHEKETSEKEITMGLDCEDGECDHKNHHHHHEGDDVTGVAGVTITEEMNCCQKKQKHTRDWPLACGILLGDAFHNFCDGIFMGNAFLLCSRSIAYTIMATTVYHELAQEIADFALLTHHCGLTTPQALITNFCSGFSTLLGGILIFSMDLSDKATGCVLAMSAGVYIYIAASGCVPRVLEQQQKQVTAQSKRQDILLFLWCFAFGAVPIGLVLLNHGHCGGEH